MTNAKVWFEIAGDPQATRKPAAPASSLSQLAAIASLSEAVALASTQGSQHSKYGSLSIQISATVSEAAVLAKAGKLNIYAMAGYLYEVIAVIEALEFMNGFGSPYGGDAFQTGHTSFAEDISSLLQDATATDWSGEGAEEYNNQNQRQQDLMIVMADADQWATDVLTTQAFQVEQGRQGLAGIRLAVFGSITVVWIITKIILSMGYTGEAAALYQLLKNFVEHVAYVAASTAFGMIMTLVIEGIQNEQRLARTIRKYQSCFQNATANIPGSTRTSAQIAIATTAASIPTVSLATAPTLRATALATSRLQA